MSRDIPATALRLVAALFDAGTVRSAVDYARRGRVHLVKPPPWPVVAQVRGTEGYVVTVHYTAATSHLRGECSCPAGGDCKHAAATALVAFAREGEHAARRLDSARQVVVGKWLADFGREERRAGSDATAERVVAYVIDARDGSLGITALQCARLRRGGLASGAVIAALGDPTRGPPRLGRGRRSAPARGIGDRTNKARNPRSANTTGAPDGRESEHGLDDVADRRFCQLTAASSPSPKP